MDQRRPATGSRVVHERFGRIRRRSSRTGPRARGGGGGRPSRREARVRGARGGAAAESPVRVRTDGKFFALGDERFPFRGVTYGTFEAREDGALFPEREVVKRDFSAMR